MVGRPGHVFTKQEIFESLWADTAVTDHALTRVVAQLRRVLGDEARESRYLETVPTRGYRWIRPVTPLTAALAAIPQAGAEAPVHSHRWWPRVLPAAMVLVAVSVTVPVVLWIQQRIGLSTNVTATVSKAIGSV